MILLLHYKSLTLWRKWRSHSTRIKWRQSEKWPQKSIQSAHQSLNRFDVESICLLKLKVSDVMFENGKVRETVKSETEENKNYTIDIPLSDHSKKSISKFLCDKMLMISFLLVRKVTTQEKRSQLFSIKNHQGWMRMLGVDDVSSYITPWEDSCESHLFKDKYLKQFEDFWGINL